MSYARAKGLRCLLAAFLMFATTFVYAADIAFDNMHLEQGFNFRSDVPDAFGFVTALKLLSDQGAKAVALKADISITNPLKQKGSVVGVLQSFKWASGLTDPMQFKFNVTTENRNTLFGLLQNPGALKSTAVEIQFAVYYYDQTAKTWYSALTTSTAYVIPAVAGASMGPNLRANFAKEGKDKLLLSLPNNLPNATVKSPQNWDVALSIMPQPISQQVFYQYAPGKQLVKNWGVTVK